MPGVLTKAYPYFESGFPLRAADLNNFVKYAEAEDRQTRIWLTGTGCIYGLTIQLRKESNDKYKLLVSKGVGITSLGYLIVNKEEKDIELGTVNSLNLTTADFMNSSADVVFGGNGAIGQNQDIKPLPDAMELSEGGDGMTLEVLTNKNYSIVLLVYLTGNRTVSGCQNCEKSILATADIRFLLLSKEDLSIIDSMLGIYKVNTEDNTIDNKCRIGVVDKENANYPYINRIILDNISNQTALADQYRQMILSGLVSIKSALNLFNWTDNKVINYFGPQLLLEILDKLKEKLDTFPSFYFQYVHAFIRDLIRTFEELVETQFGEIINYLPPENCFPRHLILGSIKKDSNKAVTTPQNRIPFFRPPYTGFEHVELEKATLLYKRLNALLEKSLFVDREGNTIVAEIPVGIRITPSAAASAPLGQQAIPYYYKVDDDLRAVWNFQLHRTGRSKSVQSYIRANNNNPPFDDPLKYQSAFDKADFYRIEGFIGKTLGEIGATGIDTDGDLISSEIHNQRRTLNLPFAIKLCTLEPATLNGKPILLFSTFVSQHPGLEHQGGVPKGGTFILVTDGGDNPKIVGDFCLPYYACCRKETTIAEFIVESPNDFWQSTAQISDPDHPDITLIVEMYTFPVEAAIEGASYLSVHFKNISQYADTYAWTVWKEGDAPGNPVGDSDLAFEHPFEFVGDQTAYLVRLTASRGNTPAVSVIKKIVLQKLVKKPPIAEFIVESPNNFEQGTGQITPDPNNPAISMNVEIYTFPVEASAEGATTLRVHFKNISQQADTYAWTVWKEGEAPGNAVSDSDLAFEPSFELIGEQTAYLVRLTASLGNAPAVSVFKKIVLQKVVLMPPIPEFIVENAVFEQSEEVWDGKITEVYTFPVKLSDGKTTLHIFFKNISQHADTYVWQVDGVNVPELDSALDFDREFEFSREQPEYTISLIASYGSQPGGTVSKIIRYREIQEIPPVAEFVVENPKDFDIDLAGDIEAYTFPAIQRGRQWLAEVHFKNTSQGADSFKWQVALDDGAPQDFPGENQGLAFKHIFNYVSETAVYTVTLLASRADGAADEIVKRVRLQKQDVKADFEYKSTVKNLATFVKKEEDVYNDKPVEKVILKLADNGISKIVVVWANKSSANADAFDWKAYRLGETKPFDESEAKKSFQPTLSVNDKETTSFVIELKASDTDLGLTDQKFVLLDVLPFGITPVQ